MHRHTHYLCSTDICRSVHPREARLFQGSTATGSFKVEEIAGFDQSDLAVGKYITDRWACLDHHQFRNWCYIVEVVDSHAVDGDKAEVAISMIFTFLCTDFISTSSSSTPSLPARGHFHLGHVHPALPLDRWGKHWGREDQRGQIRQAIHRRGELSMRWYLTNSAYDHQLSPFLIVR